MALGLGCSVAFGIFPDQGLRTHVPLHWQADFLSTELPGKFNGWGVDESDHPLILGLGLAPASLSSAST